MGTVKRNGRIKVFPCRAAIPLRLASDIALLGRRSKYQTCRKGGFLGQTPHLFSSHRESNLNSTDIVAIDHNRLKAPPGLESLSSIPVQSHLRLRLHRQVNSRPGERLSLREVDDRLRHVRSHKLTMLQTWIFGGFH